ncbi:hypothetical protein CEXT_662141 [Caerostris extrusa]|uniref:Uncharacterized protein n=1 Tax=Caerostris extrusa TaxID=172846 RepID=A0AAV4WPV5_CAEEX|nr:hypothetical protein CEXT_662141 [Caerostris extrusa]
MKRDVLGPSAPKYTDLYELSQQVPVSCDNHLNGDDSSCSKRISFTFANYLESVEENQWETEDGKKEEEEEEEEEKRPTQELKGHLSLPGSLFWTCIKAQRAAESSHSLFAFRELLIELLKMIPICDIGFVGHCHFAFTANGTVPVEISLSALRDRQSACITVDITSERFTAKNVRANRWVFRNLSKLSFPYRGHNSLESVRGEVKRLYDKKDQGRGLYVAVKGDEIKDFFVSCGLPVCEMKKEVLGDEAPKYTDLEELSQQVPVSCNNHVKGDTSSCSKRISFTFARYLESVEEDQVVIDCRDNVLDKMCLTKHNVPYKILLK